MNSQGECFKYLESIIKENGRIYKGKMGKRGRILHFLRNSLLGKKGIQNQVDENSEAYNSVMQ